MWKTRFTKAFACRLPIMVPPMADVSGGRLAAACTRAGSLGFLAAGHLQPAALKHLEEEIQIYRSSLATQSSATATPTTSPGPLCIGFISHSTLGSTDGWKRFEYVLDTYRPEVVQFFAPAIVDGSNNTNSNNTNNNVDLAKSFGAKVILQVGSVAEAKMALSTNPDAIIAQGSEAGGHGLRREVGNGTLALARNIVSLLREETDTHFDIPVLAAGGFCDGAGLAAALALGCDGVVFGTRLWASQEALGHASYKQRLIDTTSCDQVIRTTVFDHIQNSYSATPWPIPYDSVGALRNETSNEWDGRETEIAMELQDPNASQLVKKYRMAVAEGDPDVGLVHAGQGVGLMNSIETAEDILTRIEREATDILSQIGPQVLP